MRFDRGLGIALDRFDLAADILSRLGRLFRQFLHFIGDYGETLASSSPARAASMVAFSASRLVCCAIDVITLITWPISALDSPSLAIVVLVVFRCSYRCGRDLGGFGGVLRDFLDAGAYLFGTGRHRLQVLVHLLPHSKPRSPVPKFPVYSP